MTFDFEPAEDETERSESAASDRGGSEPRDAAPSRDSNAVRPDASSQRRRRRRIDPALRHPVISGLIVTVIALVLGTWITLKIVQPTERPPPRPGPDDIEPTGEITGPTHARIIKREGLVNAYVVRKGVAHHIPDGGTYVCNAAYYPVRFNVSDPDWEALHKSDGPEADCPTGTQPRIAPQEIRDNYVLYGKDRTRWFVTDGRRVRIRDAATFNCLTKRYLVWDYVSSGEIRAFPLSRTRPAERLKSGCATG